MILINSFNPEIPNFVVVNDKVLTVTRSSMNRILELSNKPKIKTELVKETKHGNIYKLSRKTNGN